LQEVTEERNPCASSVIPKASQKQIKKTGGPLLLGAESGPAKNISPGTGLRVGKTSQHRKKAFRLIGKRKINKAQRVEKNRGVRLLGVIMERTTTVFK